MLKNSIKHIIAILIISGCIFIPYFLITLPIVGVFILDNAITNSELLSVYLWLLGASLGISILIIFPLNLLFNHLSQTKKVFNWIIPLLLVPLTNIGAIIYFIAKYDYKPEIFFNFLMFFYISILFLFYRIIHKSIDRILSFIKKFIGEILL